MFNYGSFKLFLIKIITGSILMTFSIFLLVSLFTYSPADPGFGKLVSYTEISNFFGFFGAIISSFFILLFGSLSFIIPAYILVVSFFLMTGIKNNLILLKLVLIVFSIIIINFSILIKDFNFLETGFIAQFFLDVFVKIFPNFIDFYLYKNVAVIILFFTAFVSILMCFSVRINFIKKTLTSFLKITSFVILKPINYLKSFKSKENKTKVRKVKIKNEPTINKRTKLFKKDNDYTNDKIGLDDVENDLVFKLPDSSFLLKSKTKKSQKKEVEINNKIYAEKLKKVLSEYGVEGEVTGFRTGPIVTLYEFVPNAGIKASKIIGLSDDIARAMSSVSARISSQPGKTSLGIEIPNLQRENVMFGDLIENHRFETLNKSLTLALGKDISGQEVYADLEKMPHLLIAGTTGSGKSVGINTIIMSILYRFKPDECKLILIDPKMLELSIYEDIPHLLTPVVTNPNKAVFALKWVVREMENRYKLMSSLNVKNINSYNEKSKKILSSGKKHFREVQTGIDSDTKKPIIEKREIPLEKMPFIVVVIDEMADLMMVAGKEVENLVQRLAQMARASGIHLVTATQRPSVDVITGTIKANFPSRLSYKVASKFDSRTILNEMGAEQLLGSGDMLFLENGSSLKRLHGGYISEAEIENIVNHIKNQARFDPRKEISIEDQSEESSMAFKFDDGGVDALYTKAIDIVIEQQKVSTSYIQRYLQIGYNRAARIVEKMEEEGIITEANNAGKRQVLRKN